MCREIPVASLGNRARGIVGEYRDWGVVDGGGADDTPDTPPRPAKRKRKRSVLAPVEPPVRGSIVKLGSGLLARKKK